MYLAHKLAHQLQRTTTGSHSMKNARAILAIAAFIAIACTGCRTTTWSERDHANELDLQRGVRIDLTHQDGTTERGYYIGTRTMEFTDYVPRYMHLVGDDPEAQLLPVPGERISFTTRLDRQHVWDGKLLGFDSRYVWVRLRGDEEATCYWVNSLTHLRRWDGRMLQKMSLGRLIESNKVPLMVEIAMVTDEGVKYVPLNDMRQIRIQEGADPSSYKIIAQDLGEEYASRTVKTAGDR